LTPEQPEQPAPLRLFTCSPTKLNTWVDCPRRFRFAYVDRPSPPKGPPWAHLSYGTSAHNALRSWWDLPVGTRTPAAAGELVREGWLTDGYRDEDQSTKWRERAAEQVGHYASTLDATAEPVGVERTVGMRSEHLAFSGRVDRIDDRGDHLVVVDYKLGRSVPTDTDARSSMALALYAEATQRTMRRPCRRVELHHVPSGTVAAWEHDDDGVARQLARADAIGAEAQRATAAGDNEDSDADFPPAPGPLCGWCDFRAVCDEGRAAGPARAAWEGLPRV